MPTRTRVRVDAHMHSDRVGKIEGVVDVHLETAVVEERQHIAEQPKRLYSYGPI